jgi:hypothetical protein
MMGLLLLHSTFPSFFLIGNRVRRSFSVEAKQSEKGRNIFRLFHIEAKHGKSQAKRKRTKRKKPCETKNEHKSCESIMR